jgi:thiosulfate/3-mercaptopyruvate sulfurtransferase
MLVTTDWLNTHLGDPDLVILHVETPGGPAYADGHIPEARYLRWEEIAVERDRVQNEFPPMELLVATIRRLGIHGHERIVLYDTGCGLEAARAYVALELLGLGENASLLDGHWAVWRSEEREISVWEPEVVPSRFSPRPRTDVVVALEEMKGIVWFARRGEGVALLDARPGEEFSGGKAGEGVTRPGHIPGAASVCWLRNLVSKDRPLLRSREELLDLYDTVGARPGALSVVYGRTGTEACHTYFTLRWLGLDVVLYDGSFVEWSRNWKLPVATGG